MSNDRKEIIVVGAGTLTTTLELDICSCNGTQLLPLFRALRSDVLGPLMVYCLAFIAAHPHVPNRRGWPIHRYTRSRDREVQRNHRCRDVSHRPKDNPVYKPLGCERLQLIASDHVVLINHHLLLQGAHHVSQAFGDARQKGTLSSCIWYSISNVLLFMVVQHWTRKHSKQCGKIQSPMERSQDFSSDTPTLNSERMASILLRGWITCLL